MANQKHSTPPLQGTMLLCSRYVTLAAAVACIAVVALAQDQPSAATLPPLCDDGYHYPANGTFQANLDLLSLSLPANTSASPAGFATASVGAAPDEANALALCRGDINASACAACVAEAFRDAQRVCPLDTSVTVYHDACVLRFASSRFIEFLRPDQWLVSELNPVIDMAQGNVNAPDAWFSAAVTGMLTALVDRAAVASNSTKKYFATGEMEFDPKIYGLAQCTPDLTPGQCRGCLGLLLVTTTNKLQGRRALAGSAFVVWCQLRYSVSRVYEGQATLQLPAPPEPPTQATLAPPTSESGASMTPKFLWNDDRGTKEIAVLATAIALVLLSSG